MRSDLFEAAKWVPFILEEIMTQEGEKLLTGNHHSLCVLGGKHAFLVLIPMPFITNPLSGLLACIGKAAAGSVLGNLS